MNFKNAIEIKNNSVIIYIYIILNSKKDCFPYNYNKWRNRIEAKISSIAKNEKANIKLIDILSSVFKLNISNITIISGHHNQYKTI